MTEREELFKEIKIYNQQVSDLINSIGPKGVMDFDTSLALNTRYQELIMLFFKHHAMLEMEYNNLAEHTNVIIRENNQAVSTIKALQDEIDRLKS
jgi:hypothetical protein